MSSPEMASDVSCPDSAAREEDTAENETTEASSSGYEDHEVYNDEDDLSTIDENYDVTSLASSIEDQLTWRGRMQVILHSTCFHITIVALVILDMAIVLFELLLDVNAFGNIVCPDGNFLEQAEFCHFHEDSRSMCAPTPRLILQGISLPYGVEQEKCACGFQGGRQVCVPRSVLSSIAKVNAELHKARLQTKNIIHAFHKAQIKLRSVEVERDSFKMKLEEATTTTQHLET